MSITRTLRSSTKAALDLASVMVGVVVIGIVGSVISATVFIAVPWAQDNVAKTALQSISVAQAAATGYDSKYLNYVDLTTAKLIQTSSKVVVVTNDTKTCFVAASKSDSGTIFYSTNDISEPKSYEPGDSVACTSLAQVVAPLRGNPVGALPAVSLADAKQTLAYSVQPHNYRKDQMRLVNITIGGDTSDKKDWELRVRVNPETESPFDQIISLDNIEDSRVSWHKDGDYYVFNNNQLGPYGNGVSTTSSFVFTIIFNIEIRTLNDVTVASAAPTGGQWYATQNVTVNTQSVLYGYWKVRVDLTELKQMASSTTKIQINDSNLKITPDVGNYYWIEPINQEFVVQKDNPKTFTISAVN